MAKLWGGKSTPLLQPVHAKNTAKILSKLDLQLDKYNFMSTCKSDVQNVEDEMDGFPFRIQFDVYLPKVPFRKSSPHLPNYRVAVCKSSDPLPTHSDVTNLTGCYGDAVPLLFAICTISSVSFYCFSKVQLPKIISKGWIQKYLRNSWTNCKIKEKHCNRNIILAQNTIIESD